MNGQRARWLIMLGTVLGVFGILWVVAGDGLSLGRLRASVESNQFWHDALLVTVGSLLCWQATRESPSRTELETVQP